MKTKLEKNPKEKIAKNEFSFDDFLSQQQRKWEA
jgi:hypothetical protein